MAGRTRYRLQAPALLKSALRVLCRWRRARGARCTRSARTGALFSRACVCVFEHGPPDRARVFASPNYISIFVNAEMVYPFQVGVMVTNRPQGRQQQADGPQAGSPVRTVITCVMAIDLAGLRAIRGLRATALDASPGRGGAWRGPAAGGMAPIGHIPAD